MAAAAAGFVEKAGMDLIGMGGSRILAMVTAAF